MSQKSVTGKKGRVTMIVTGSRGDVQPQAALGQRLQAAGWQVRFATHRCFQPLADAAGLELFPLSGDSTRLFSGAAGPALRDRRRMAGVFKRFLKPFIKNFLIECVDAADGADAILYWPPTRVGPALSEKLQVPCFGISTYPLPHCRTRYFPNPFAEPLSPGLAAMTRWPLLKRWANLHTWNQEERVWRGIFEQEVAHWRREILGLGQAGDLVEDRLQERIPHLLGYSATVLPVPKDWPPSLHVTGYWFLDLASDWQPPQDLVEFLENGPRPIAIGFGSMVTGNDRATTEIVLEAVRQANVRAILLAGWGGLDQSSLGHDVYFVKEAPHDWLFPRICGVVHHGGSGTTAAGLRAGLPTLVVPFGYDQFLWGRRTEALGVGPRPIAHEQLTVEGLTDRLRRLTADPSMMAKARTVGEKIQCEDGPSQALEAFERHMATGDR